MRKGGEVMGKSALTRQNVESDKFTLVYTVLISQSKFICLFG